MGADLLTANLWSKQEVHIDQFDWEAGRRVARELDEGACQRLAEQACIYVEDGDDSPRGLAEKYVQTLREHLTGWSRELSTFDTPDGKWICWVTGGMSWGDSPGDLYDAMNDLWAVPEVLAAIGFWTGTSEPPVDESVIEDLDDERVTPKLDQLMTNPRLTRLTEDEES